MTKLHPLPYQYVFNKAHSGSWRTLPNFTVMPKSLKYNFWLFLITMVTIFSKIFAHVLNWVKTYHHAEFQRNPPTGLAGMMDRQIDRQTDRQTDRQILFFPRHAIWLKTISGGSPPSLKVWSKFNRNFEKRINIVT